MPRPARLDKKRASIFRRLFSFFSSGKVFFPLFLLFTFFLVQSFFRIRERSGQLDLFEDEVSALRDKVGEKLGDLEYRGSSEFVYKEALEQLGYTRPGEVIVVLPDFEKEKEKTDNGSQEAEENQSSQNPAEPVPNWKKWRILFFGS